MDSYVASARLTLWPQQSSHSLSGRDPCTASAAPQKLLPEFACKQAPHEQLHSQVTDLSRPYDLCIGDQYTTISMADVHRKIELQEQDDLLYLVNNARRRANERIDLALPPIEGEDALRQRVEELVHSVSTLPYHLRSLPIFHNFG
jgi:hypothetical protein